MFELTLAEKFELAFFARIPAVREATIDGVTLHVRERRGRVIIVRPGVCEFAVEPGSYPIEALTDAVNLKRSKTPLQMAVRVVKVSEK